MSTAPSSTEARYSWIAEARRAVEDTRSLFAFRASTLRGRTRTWARVGLMVMGVLTLLAAWLPAYLPEGDQGRRTDVLALLPSALVGIFAVAVLSAAASGGGRELLPRDQAVAYPVTPAVDHLGALLMAPLNIAWLLQSWTLLGGVAYVLGPHLGLVFSQLLMLLWLVAATSVAQVAGWAVEWVRRGAGGTWAVRGLTLAVFAGLVILVVTDSLAPALERSPTVRLVIVVLATSSGVTLAWWWTALILIGLTAAAVCAGAWVAAATARRSSRDVASVETTVHAPRANPASDLIAMMRTDRAGLWRSVPLRRGLVVLAIMPGLVAIAGSLTWDQLSILPGLVASGGALLFGVNSWCLDGRGALWRDSLPADDRLVFASRALVLAEILGVATTSTLVMATVRAGLPSIDEFAAVAAGTLVVIVQVVSASLRWSVRRPFAVDLRSPRATPAPPLVMVGYSSRLALVTTFVGMTFSGLARLSWEWSVLVALPLLLLSAYRLVRTAKVWADPVERARVVATVAV